MTRREKLAWGVAAVGWMAAVVVGFSDFDKKPEWILVNTEYGAIRMDRNTGYTERLGGRGWRSVNFSPTPPKPFDPDKYLSGNHLPAASPLPE